MNEYDIQWEVTVTAETPEQAAYEAWLMQRRDSIATVFVVDGVFIDAAEVPKRILRLPIWRDTFSQADIELIGGGGQQDNNVADLIKKYGFELPEKYALELAYVKEYVCDFEDESRENVLAYLIWICCGNFYDDSSLTLCGE